VLPTKRWSFASSKKEHLYDFYKLFPVYFKNTICLNNSQLLLLLHTVMEWAMSCEREFSSLSRVTMAIVMWTGIFVRLSNKIWPSEKEFRCHLVSRARCSLLSSEWPAFDRTTILKTHKNVRSKRKKRSVVFLTWMWHGRPIWPIKCKNSQLHTN
jgi:hypothetical protein